MKRGLMVSAVALVCVSAFSLQAAEEAMSDAEYFERMPAYQYPPQRVSMENAKHWAWMRAFYEREVSHPTPNETLAEVAVRASNVRPTPEKLAYMDMELISFPHFGMSTQSGVQQGTGKEDPRSFNPVNFDADEWVRVHKLLGSEMIVFVAKHHDGYALWPSKLNDYSIRSSPWRDGKGDMVKEMAEACRRGGLKLGFYISLWDEHDPRSVLPRNKLKAHQMTDEQRRTYQTYIETQLHETLDGRYGEITELWLDGAGTNGAEDWNRIYEIVHRYQPKCLVVMCGFGARWCGNEGARCQDVNWNVAPMIGQLHKLQWVPFHYQQLIRKNFNKITDDLNQLMGKELFFLPQEADTSFLVGRDGKNKWHWEAGAKPKPLKTLVDIYYESIGKGAVLITSPAPDPTGAFNPEQIERIKEWRHWMDESFKDNLLKGATVTLTGWKRGYDPQNLFGENRDTPCFAADGATEFVIGASFDNPKTFNNLMVEEYLVHGQRIASFVFEAWQNGEWSEVVGSRTVGRKRVVRFNDITSEKVRFRITDTRDLPAIRFIGLYKALPYE